MEQAEGLGVGCWQDITEDFKDAVKYLDLGELIKTEQFTLLDAMSALELMDPKMDSGLIFNKLNRQVLSLDQSIEAGIVKVSNLEPEELIGIIDDTYACLVTWLDGHSLAYTVMTNLYLRDTDKIEDRTLRIFSQAILKIVEYFDRLVQMVYCIDEEDFAPNNGQFNLANHISDQKVLSTLEYLCLQYEKNLAGSLQQTNDNDHKDANDQKSQNGTKLSPSETESKKTTAIANRLRFTSNLFSCMQNIAKNILKDYAVSGPNSAALTQKTVKQFLGHVATCNQRLDKCLEFRNKWNESIDLGIKAKVKLDQDKSYTTDYPTIMGFDPLINLKYLAPSYYRNPSMKTRSETLDYLRDLILKLKECITISNCFYQKSFDKSLEAIEQFSKYYPIKSCVISRSFIQALYLPNRLSNSTMLKDELYQSLNDYCEPMMQILKKDTIKTQAINEFLEESTRVFNQVIALFGHNPGRQHDGYPDLIQTFKNLQYSAFLVSDILKNNLVYSWTTYYFAKLCIKYVLSGLELELFSPHEYPYVFWYLYDILYRNEKEQLEYAKELIFESQNALDQDNVTSQTNKQGNKTKGGTNKKPRKKTLVNTSLHDKNLLLNDALRFLTGGIFLLTYGLKLQGKIKSPSLEYTSEEICFNHRFGTITGSSVFQAYKFTLSRLEKIDSIYNEAFECFSEARIMFEKYGDGQEECLKVCKTNMIVAKILSSNSNSFAEREVEFCFDRHPGFLTVKL